MLKIRRSRERPNFNMGIPIHDKDCFYIEMGSCGLEVAFQFIGQAYAL